MKYLNVLTATLALWSLNVLTATASPLDPLAPIEKYEVQQNSMTALGEGYDALAHKDYARAEKLFRQVMQAHQKSPSPLIALAELARIRGQAAEAEKWIRQAETVSPESAETQLALARLYISKRQWEEAEKAYKKLAVADPKALPLGLGELYLNAMNRPDLAAEQFRRAIRLKSDHAGAHYGLGSALLVIDDIRGAVAEMAEAVRLEPTNPLAYEGLGRARLRKGEYKQAIDSFQHALELQPNFPAALIELGDAQVASGRLDAGIKSYQAVEKIDDKLAIIPLKMGMAYQQAGKRKEAYDAYLKAIQLDSTQALALNNMAWMAAQNKERLADALRWAKQAVDIAPKALTFQDTLAMVHVARKENEAALAVLEKIAQNDRPPADALYHLGVVKSGFGKKDEAVAALRRALQIDPNFSNARDAVARIQQLEQKK